MCPGTKNPTSAGFVFIEKQKKLNAVNPDTFEKQQHWMIRKEEYLFSFTVFVKMCSGKVWGLKSESGNIGIRGSKKEF